MEAEEQLSKLPNERDADEDFFALVVRVTRCERAARRALHARVLNRKWSQTDGV
jgi:hypothetical protein